MVVMNGPDAMAGSNFNVLIRIGTTVPLMVERLRVMKMVIPSMSARTAFL